MVNGKGKSHVKLYLDHDFCRLANLPLASSSLWAQLLQALWAWHWMLSCCREKWVSQVHSAQAATRERKREREAKPLRLITNQTKLHFLSIIIKFYRAMLEIRYDPPSKYTLVHLVSYSTTCCPSISSHLSISSVEINKLCVENSIANVAILCHFRCHLSVICSTWKWYIICVCSTCVCHNIDIWYSICVRPSFFSPKFTFHLTKLAKFYFEKVVCDR